MRLKVGIRKIECVASLLVAITNHALRLGSKNASPAIGSAVANGEKETKSGAIVYSLSNIVVDAAR